MRLPRPACRTWTAANPVAAAPVVQPPTIDEVAQGEPTAESEGESAASNPMLWVVPLIAVICVLAIMIVINNARARARRRSRYTRRRYGSYDPYHRR